MFPSLKLRIRTDPEQLHTVCSSYMTMHSPHPASESSINSHTRLLQPSGWLTNIPPTPVKNDFSRLPTTSNTFHLTLDNNQMAPLNIDADNTGMTKLSSNPHTSTASESPATNPVKLHSSHKASLLVERVHETLPSRVKLKSKMECLDQ